MTSPVIVELALNGPRQPGQRGKTPAEAEATCPALLCRARRWLDERSSLCFGPGFQEVAARHPTR
jgi:hypothetical protein